MKSKMSSIVQAGLGKRLAALVMDGVVFAFLWGCLVAWAAIPIANKAFGYQNNLAKGSHYEGFSKLYLIKETTVSGDVRIIEPSEFSKMEPDSKTTLVPLYDSTEQDPEFYRARIKYYYLNFKTNQNIEYDPNVTDPAILETYYSPDYNKEITLQDGRKVLPKDYYTEDWFNANFGPEKFTDLKTVKNIAYDTVAEFYNSAFFTEINNQIKGAQCFIIFPAWGISFLIFYLLFPLIFKNGETLGKKVVHIGFVNKEGYDIKKRQIIFRQLLLFLYISLCTFVVGIGLTSLATLGVGVFIYLIATIIPKSHKSPIDFAAMTYLIDTSKSVWFHDAEEENEKEEDFETKMAKYRSKKVENKNLIQVGTEIVDEKVKKEFEEENSKKKISKNL